MTDFWMYEDDDTDYAPQRLRIKIFDNETCEHIGSAYWTKERWMDDVDCNLEREQVATVWASDHGRNVDEIDWEDDADDD